MKTLFLAVSLLFITLVSQAQSGESLQNAQAKSTWQNSLGKGFTENKGQMQNAAGQPVPFVFAQTGGRDVKMYITNKGISYVLTGVYMPDVSAGEEGKIKSLRIDEDLLGASIKKENIEWFEQTDQSRQNFYNAVRPNGLFEVYSWNKIRIRNIYPGINWLLYFTETGIKYDFEIGAGADPSLIRLQIKGADEVKIKADGSLFIHTRVGDIGEEKPFSMQGGKKLTTRFIQNPSCIQFHVDGYDKSASFIIDPTLIWATFFGGSNDDALLSLCTDPSGNMFATGYASSNDFPLQNAGAYFDNQLSGTDAVICKFGPAGNLIWSTYYGGSSAINDNDKGFSIKTDAAGNVFVTGSTTTANFPTQNNGNYFDGILNNGTNAVAEDAFLLKFTNGGTRILATFIGGTQSDIGRDLEIDGGGNVFIAGYTSSADFPLLTNGGYFDNSYAAGDGFIMKLNNSGVLNWSTYFGGNADDRCTSISADASGNIFIAGSTNSGTQFPLQNNGTYYDAILNNGTAFGTDCFIAKFNSGSALVWSTYYGGTASDEAQETVVDNNNNLIVTGTTSSNDFSTQASGAYYLDNTLDGFSDIFILKFNNNGTRLWATYYGGSGDESISLNSNVVYYNDGVKTDGCGNIYVGFSTRSSNITTVNPGCNAFYDNNLSTYSDCFLIQFSRYGVLNWATYLGGESTIYNVQLGSALTVSKNNTVTLSGAGHESFGFPFMQNGSAYYDNTTTSNYDAFLMRFKPPVIDAGVSYADCAGGCNGTATAQINSNCPATYIYNWSTGGTTQTINNLCPGSYSVIVQDTVHCISDTANFTLSQGFQFFPVVSAYSCSFSCTGTASVSIPGASNLTYSWSTGGTTSSVSGLCPGNYTVTVSSPGCGSHTVPFTIATPPPLIISVNSLIYNTTSPCSSICDGTATVAFTGGLGPVYCSWSNGTIGTTITNLCPGVTYTVTGTDSICFTSFTTVTTPVIPPMSTTVNTTPSCNCNGTASAYPYNGGPSPYAYLWSNGQTTQNIANLCPGNYWVIISSSCSIDTTNFTITSPSPLVISNISVFTPPCPHQCNGEAQVNFSGGISPYTFQWSNGQTSPNANGLCDDSTYYVTITDACGGIDIDSVVVHADTNSFQVIAFATVYVCAGSCTGVAIAGGNGGVAPYTYLWSNGQTGFTCNNLCPGTNYWVIGTDQCQISDTFNFMFPYPSAPTVSFTTVPSCLASCVGEASANVSGGIAPFAFLWNTGAPGPNLFNACANTSYSVTVTDFCGATVSGSVNIPVALPLSANISVLSPSCYNSCNGTATVNFTGGTPPFTYHWSNNVFSQTAGGLCPDSSYYVVIEDPGCETDTFYVNFPGLPALVASSSSSSSSCPGICSGTATATHAGGLAPYSYLWSNGQTTATANSLCPGNYFCIITDGCNAHDTTYGVIGLIPAVIATIPNQVNNDCYNGCTGTATLSTSSGSPPFTYLWSNGQTGLTATNLCAGTYSVIVTDPGCSVDTAYVTITSPAIMNTSLNLQDDTVICKNNCDGVANVLTSGGIPPFNYIWSNGSNTASVNNLCAGNNFVIVQDPGCSADTIYFSIGFLSDIHVNANALSPAICFGDCNGSASGLAYAGIPPYSYSWTGGQATTTATNLCAGPNVITAIDSLGCIAKDTVIISQPPQLIIDPTYIQSHCENPDGEISVLVSGGTSPYIYIWNTGNQTTTITDLIPDWYSIVVTDDHLCTAYDTFQLIGSYPVLHITPDTTIILGNSVQLYVSGADFYSWYTDPHLNCTNCYNPVAFNLETETYCVIGTDVYGCMDTACVTVIIDENCGDLFIPNAFSPNGDGVNDIFRSLAWCIDQYYLAVFDRWGNKLYETNVYTEGWNGVYKGVNMEIDVYVFYVEATTLTGRHIFKKGNVSLIR